MNVPAKDGYWAFRTSGRGGRVTRAGTGFATGGGGQ